MPQPKHKHDAELGDLWSRRKDLSEAEWGRLYALVWDVLLPYRPSELASLSDESQDYVQSFFEKKVLTANAAADGQRVHVGGLRYFYKMFLRDRLDQEKRRLEAYSLDSTLDDECESLVERLPAAEPEPFSDPAAFKLLAEAGVTVERIVAAADTWLSGQEQWVPVYLGMHFCPDADVAEPLYKLAKRLGIASHHYKAERLGINWSLEKAGGKGKPFAETLLGRWIVEDLGFPIDDDNRPSMLAAFKILCHQALIRAEQLESGS